jgi:catechol 2,3-dioxygenase-like lactoylglutathione lyase family enzyme
MRLSVVVDCADPASLVPFWEAALGYRRADTIEGYAALVPKEGDAGPVLLLQQVPEAKVGKNRVHLDVHPKDAQGHVAALERLGGRRLGGWVEDALESVGIRWQVMADPQGNELCVVDHVR